MTSFGRGRGFTRSEEREERELRRPKQPAVSEINPEYNDLKAAIISYNPTHVDSGAILNTIAIRIANEIENDDAIKLRKMLNYLHNCALSDENFAVKYANAIFNTTLLTQQNQIFSKKYFILRRNLLEILQDDYETRHEIRYLCKKRSSISMYLFAKCFTALKVKSKPINILIDPLINSMRMLMKLDKEDILMFVIMYLETRTHLHSELDELLLEMRELLMNKKAAHSSKILFLFVLDVEAYSKIGGFPPFLKNFYKNRLEENDIHKIRFYIASLVDPYLPKITTDETSSATQLTIYDLNLSDEKNEVDNEQLKNYKSDTAPTPRAILGTGAIDKQSECLSETTH